MFLTSLAWFLIGALSILFLYFITFYFTKKSETYNLLLSIGCLASIIRIITYNVLDNIDSSYSYYRLAVIIIQLTFIWGPCLYVILAKTFFVKIKTWKVVEIFLAVNLIISIFIIFFPEQNIYYGFLYDYLIIAYILFATYIFIAALIKKEPYSISFFIANSVFVIGIVHDVLLGSYIIKSNVGEIFAYSYLFYLYIASVVSAKKQVYADKKRLESELNFLHAQIQPHFLYNTINTIIAYSRKDPEKARELLIELSTYLRGKFKNQKEIYTSLKDEIALIKSYLTIEQVRFEDRISVEYDIDEDCNILIPCLILQPIVENAVKHGLAPKKDGGHLKISIKKAQNTVVAKIIDDGVGMDSDKLNNIFVDGNDGIGLSNTNERLKQHYGTEIVVKSEKGIGSEFTVTIPLKRG
ncbi:MAG: histidine kinase [Clostridia bacterium]|nr:histidine kinase [Clostridia bacterium]